MSPEFWVRLKRVLAELTRRVREGSPSQKHNSTAFGRNGGGTPPIPPYPPSVGMGPEDESVKTYPWLYGVMLAGVVAFWISLGWFFHDQTFTVANVQLSVGYLLMVAGALQLVAGMVIVDANKVGGIFVLGWPTIQVSGQFILVPPLVSWLIQESLLTEEMEIPAEPENIWRGEDPPPADQPNLRPPVRITFAEGDDQNDPLQRRVTQEVTFFVRLRIENFFDFYVRIGDLEEARHQLEDVGVSYLAEVLPNHTLSDAIKKVDEYSRNLRTRLIEATRGWGAKVVSARVKQFPFSKSLNESIQKMAQSTAEKRAAIITAEGEKEKRTLEGQGTANAVRAELDARTQGMKKMAEDLGINKELVLGAETARSIGQGPSDKIILGVQGFAEMLSVGKAIASTQQNGK